MPDAFGRQSVPAPQFISADVEISSVCNNRCLMCPREAITRPQGIMTLQTFSRLLTFLEGSRCLLTFSGMGDPLLSPDLPEFIIRASAQGHETGVVVHPASLARKNGMERLLECLPHSITVSFPSVRQEIFERLCPTITMDNAINTVLTLREKVKGRRGRIRVSGIITRLNRDEEDEFRTFWKTRKIPCWITQCHSRGGNLNQPDLHDNRQTPLSEDNVCSLFLFHNFITWQGEILACCHDLGGNTSLGTIHSTGRHKNLTALKKRMVSRLPCPPFKLCRHCDEPLRDLALPPVLPETGEPRRGFFRKLAAVSGRTKA